MSVNLMSLYNVLECGNEVADLYKDVNNIELKSSEGEDLKVLIDTLRSASAEQNALDKFIISYKIKNIGKEFDLLRIDNNIVINIEIKRRADKEKIIKQLEKNYFYLKSLGLKTRMFTFTANNKRLYEYVDKELYEVAFEDLLRAIESQEETISKNILDELFSPSEFIISPFNHTNDFMNNRYFLNNHQKDIFDEVLELKDNFYTFTGGPGTGKSLLLYHLAKSFIEKGEKVSIIHSGKTNDGHDVLKNDYNWKIYNAKSFLEALGEADFIFIDETQRLYRHSLDKIIDYAKENDKKCFFSIDPVQYITDVERNYKNHECLEEHGKTYKLTDKIRSNEEIASFTKEFFDRGKQGNIKYKSVQLEYFSNLEEAKKYVEYLNDSKWKVLSYTESNRHSFEYDAFIKWDNTHRIIGQEYDEVAIIITKEFSYYQNKLYFDSSKYGYYYSPTKMLFQNITRARKKIKLVVVDNPHMLENVLEILNK